MGNAWQLYVCPYLLISFRDKSVSLEDAKKYLQVLWLGSLALLPGRGQPHCKLDLFFSKQQVHIGKRN